MWMVVHMAKSKTLALEVCQHLEREGFLVRLCPVYRARSDEENYFELMVPEAEAAEARQVLLDRGLC